MSISALNKYCQSNKLILPDFKYDGLDTHWICTADFNLQNWRSKPYTTKKLAKEDVTHQIMLSITQEVKNVELPADHIFLIDGDQRMDCWKWLAKCSWNETTNVTVFISPTCPVVSSDNILIVKSKTTNRDSSDALILISLGKIFASDEFKYKKLVIVSSDHILVQAAQDFGLTYIPHLQGLKDYLTL